MKTFVKITHNSPGKRLVELIESEPLVVDMTVRSVVDYKGDTVYFYPTESEGEFNRLVSIAKGKA